MKVTLLGTGSPEAHRRRASSGYLVEVGEETLLLDCGGGVFDRLVQSGRRPSDVDRLFLTHLHSDHMMDYARLVHARWDEGADNLLVQGPPPTAAISEKLFGRDGVFAADLTARTESEGSKAVWVARGGSLPRPWPEPQVTDVMPGFSADGKGWKLTSCEVPHAQPHLVCMAFRIDAGGHSIVYSGDSGPCEALETMAKDADILIHWCYRLSHETANAFIAANSPPPVDTARMAQRAGVKKLILTHFRPHMDAEGVHDQVRAEMAGAFGGESLIAEDLMQFELGKE